MSRFAEGCIANKIAELDARMTAANDEYEETDCSEAMHEIDHIMYALAVLRELAREVK